MAMQARAGLGAGAGEVLRLAVLTSACAAADVRRPIFLVLVLVLLTLPPTSPRLVFESVSHLGIYSGALCGANGSKAIQWHSAHTLDPRPGLPPSSCAWRFDPGSVEGKKHVGGCGSCVHDPYAPPDPLRLPTHVC